MKRKRDLLCQEFSAASIYMYVQSESQIPGCSGTKSQKADDHMAGSQRGDYRAV